MTHEEALNLILANACTYYSEENFREFNIELCCANFIVKAESIGDMKYKIISCEKQNEKCSS